MHFNKFQRILTPFRPKPIRRKSSPRQIREVCERESAPQYNLLKLNKAEAPIYIFNPLAPQKPSELEIFVC